MNKRIDSKQALAVLLTVIIIIGIYAAYSFLTEKTEKNFCRVAFDSTGGTKVNTIIVKKYETITKPQDPIKEGYIFKYWALDGIEYDFDLVIENDINLIAIWEND